MLSFVLLVAAAAVASAETDPALLLYRMRMYNNFRASHTFRHPGSYYNGLASNVPALSAYDVNYGYDYDYRVWHDDNDRVRYNPFFRLHKREAEADAEPFYYGTNVYGNSFPYPGHFSVFNYNSPNVYYGSRAFPNYFYGANYYNRLNKREAEADPAFFNNYVNVYGNNGSPFYRGQYGNFGSLGFYPNLYTDGFFNRGLFNNYYGRFGY